MAFTELYCDPVNGSNLNGGSDAGSSPSYTSTNGNWDGTSIYTPTDGSTPASSVTVGQYASVFIDGATVGVCLAQVTAVAAGVNGAITVIVKAGTAPTSSATARSIKVGGAFLGPNGASGFPFTLSSLGSATDSNGDLVRVNLKNNAVYSITASITVTMLKAVIQGYTSSPGDGGRAVVDGGTTGTSFVLLNVTGGENFVYDFVFQNNGASGSATGVSLGASNTSTNNRGVRLTVRNIRGTGIFGGVLDECEAFNCNLSNGTLAGINAAICRSSIAYHNTQYGFLVGNACVAVDCIADSNSLAGFGVTTGATNPVSTLIGCTSYNQTNGVSMPSGNPVAAINCHFINNTTGVNCGTTVAQQSTLVNCGFYGNTTNTTNINSVLISGSITYASNPLNNPGAGDFSLASGSTALGAGRGFFEQTLAISGNVTAASNASPIQITTQYGHGLSTGMSVTISGVGGNTAANGTFAITKVDALNFTLNGSAGNGAYTSGGTWSSQPYYTKTTTSYPDVGAVQNQPTGGGGSGGTASVLRSGILAGVQR